MLVLPPIRDDALRFDAYILTERDPVLLKNQIVLHGSSILHATAPPMKMVGPAVSIRAGGSEVPSSIELPENNVNKPMATVYVETQTGKKWIDGKWSYCNISKSLTLLISPKSTVALGAQFQITGINFPP